MRIASAVALALVLLQPGPSRCWQGKSLQCWQCASIPGSTTRCPKDASLYRLSDWDACMTWTLKWNHRIVLQNFVKAAEDCTRSRLQLWTSYIQLVWKLPGKASCCFEDMCNDGSGDGNFIHPHADIPISDVAINSSNDVDEALPAATTPITTTPPADEDLFRPVTSALTRPSEDVGDEAVIEADECRRCHSIKNAVCDTVMLGSHANRVTFDAMVASMQMAQARETRTSCRCLDGFIPIYESQDKGRFLSSCHDPIISTSTVGGRCLIPQHCHHLDNAECKEEDRIPDYKSCQCKEGYIKMAANQSDSLVMSCKEAKPASEEGCSALKWSCATNVTYSHCNPDTEECECQRGFIPVYESARLIECKDPIVLTAAVDGFCLVDEHCRRLVGTTCQDPGDSVSTFNRCRCVDGYVPGQPNSLTGLVGACIEAGSTADNGNGQWTTSNNSLPILDEDLLIQIVDSDEEGKVTSSELSSCKSQKTVVETKEWVPNEKLPMRYDPVIEARSTVFYAKIPHSAQPSDGVLIRLLSESPDFQSRLMYTVTLFKNREITILKSFVDTSGQQRENLQFNFKSESFKWLTGHSYTGFWLIYKRGFIAIGLVNEDTLDEPLLQWMDPLTPYDVHLVGFSSVGSAVFYGLDCNLDPELFYPRGTCLLDDQSCQDKPNTRCVRRSDEDTAPPSYSPASGNASNILSFPSCECQEGFVPIPSPFRSLDRGCYDPIHFTVTVGGECMSDRHCQRLPNTECRQSLSDRSRQACRCIRGTLPMSGDPSTGLTLGCEKSPRSKLLSVASCRRKFSLLQDKRWMPLTMIKMNYVEQKNIYSLTFYVKYSSAKKSSTDSGPTIIALKLINAKKDPDKLYKVTLSSDGQIGVFENIRGSTFLFGTFYREVLQASIRSLAEDEFADQFVGYWIRYDTVGGISIGRVGSTVPLQSWRDLSDSHLHDAEHIGFELEQGHPTDIAADCYDE